MQNASQLQKPALGDTVPLNLVKEGSEAHAESLRGFAAVAVALGACMVERHLTLDRAMWGSDQAASVEPGGFERLVKYIRVTEESLGDGVKQVYESEMGSLKKLRRVKDGE